MKGQLKLAAAALAAALFMHGAQAAPAAAEIGQPLHEPFCVTAVEINPDIAVRRVSFKRSNDIILVGNLFLPAGFDAARKYPVIICVHPAGSVKEQAAGLYGYLMAQEGFVTLAYDSSYAGESGGTPHNQEAPYERVEDLRYAVDFVTTLPFADEHNIGALGICAGGGYVIASACTERRIKALAGVSAADIGAANRYSWTGGRSVEDQIKLLEAIGEQRTREARGEEQLYIYMCPEPDENTDPSFVEGYEYYRTSRAYHPRADNLFTRVSQEHKMALSAIANMELLTQPLLLAAGSKADSLWQAERFQSHFNNENQQVVLIDGASHIDLYDKEPYVSEVRDHLAKFFKHWLAL